MLVLRHNLRSTMKTTKHTPEQIITKLRTVEALTAEGATIAEAAKQIGVSEQTVYRWKRQYGQMDRKQVKRLKELEKENARLKKLVADLALDKDILKEALSGKY
jgi:transposase-like protein